MSAEKLDWFSAGVLPSEAAVTDEHRELLTLHAERFLRAQGTISWSEWQLLTDSSRSAFLEAAGRLDRERASLIAKLLIEAFNGDSKVDA